MQTSTTMWRMRILAVGPNPVIHDAWIESYDVDAFDGMGSVHATDTASKAYLFDSHMHLVQEWNRVSRLMRWRPDGHLNRPLKIFTIKPEPVLVGVYGGVL